MIRKILLFLSAFVPMYALVIIKMFIDVAEGEERATIMLIVVMIVVALLLSLGVIGITYVFCSKKISRTTIKITNVNNVTGQYFFGYFSLFVLLAVHLELYSVCDIMVFFIINIVITIVYIHSNLYYINPLLNVMGYNIYKVTYKDSDGSDVNINVFIKDKIEKGDTITIKTLFNHNFCIGIE